MFVYLSTWCAHKWNLVTYEVMDPILRRWPPARPLWDTFPSSVCSICSHTSAQHLHRTSNPACRSKLSESEVILESPKFSGIIKKRVIPRRQRESLFSGASRHCCGELILNFTCFIPRTSWGLVISEKTTFPSHAFMIKLYLRSGKHSEKMRHPLQFGGGSPLYAINMHQLTRPKN